MEQKCAGCGSTKVEKCHIEGASIRLEQASTLKKVFSVGTVISTHVCLECGLMGPLRGDPEALRKALA